MSKVNLSGLTAFFVAMFVATTLSAHPGHEVSSGFLSGLMHPLHGLDHLLAILASGLLALRVRDRRREWGIPLAFVGLMLAGGALAAAGIALPMVEPVILFSVLILGLVVALVPKVSVLPAAALVGLFAVFHGFAHVAESSGSLLSYMAGFGFMTFLLHAVAIGLGRLVERPQLIRYAGAGIASCTFLLAFQI